MILLLFTAGPVNISDAKNDSNVGAILLCFYPGQAAGEALRRVLAAATDGTVVSPAARLPYTWPASLVQVNQRSRQFFHLGSLPPLSDSASWKIPESFQNLFF